MIEIKKESPVGRDPADDRHVRKTPPIIPQPLGALAAATMDPATRTQFLWITL
jgi:hypothetical protein